MLSYRIVEFSALAKGMERLEAIQTFILLLFLAQDRKVSLLQNEETEEMYITVGNLNIAGNQQAGK
jgi:chromatin segregation and condensation protein Rec8/ScpA/Scc1 (kleisin family)